MAATLLLASGVALAAVLTGTDGPDELVGDDGDDSITGLEGGDFLAGDPTLFGPGGGDRLSGGKGDDIMDAFNDPAVADYLSCGSGDDVAYVDGRDSVSEDCEKVLNEPYPDPWDLRFSTAP